MSFDNALLAKNTNATKSKHSHSESRDFFLKSKIVFAKFNVLWHTIVSHASKKMKTCEKKNANKMDQGFCSRYLFNIIPSHFKHSFFQFKF